jgi:hypothetical protein
MREIIKVPLRTDEYRALEQLAERELRPVPTQAHHMILEALRQRRLLSPQGEPKREKSLEAVAT